MKNKLFVNVDPGGNRIGIFRGAVTDVVGGRFYHLRFDVPKRHRRILGIEDLVQFAFFDDEKERDEYVNPTPPPEPEHTPAPSQEGPVSTAAAPEDRPAVPPGTSHDD